MTAGTSKTLSHNTSEQALSANTKRIPVTALIMFAVITLGGAAGNFSQTAMNVMLVDVRLDFGVDVDTSQLLTTVYMLVIGITVPIVAYISKRLSMRTMLNLSWAFLAIGGLIDLTTSNFWLFLVGRVLQAISTGISMPVGMTFAMLNFPSHRQGTAMGIAGIAMGFAPNVGPLIGGGFSESVGWRYFFILIFGIAVLLFIATCIWCNMRPKNPAAGHLDSISVLLSTLGFGGVLLGCSNASTHELTSLFIWIPLVIGVISVALFIVRQKISKAPLINMAIFKSYHFRIGFIMQNTLTASFMGVSLILPVYVTNLCGGTAVDAGMVFLPAAIWCGICNPVAGILSDKIGTRKVVLFAGVFLVIGACSMAFIDADTPLWLTATLQMIRGIGVSTCVSPIFQWSLSTLPREVVMDGSSFSNTVRQSFAAICAAIMVFFIVFFGSYEGVDPAFGYHLAFGFSGLLGLATFVLAIVKLRD